MVKYILVFSSVFLLCAQAHAACDVYGNCPEEDDPLPSIFSHHKDVKDSAPADNSVQDNVRDDYKKHEEVTRTLEGVMRLETDSSGMTTGFANGEHVRTYTNNIGVTMGKIGNDRVRTYTDTLGNISGTVGDERVRLHQNSLGGVSGTIGDEHVSCYTNSIGMTNCH